MSVLGEPGGRWTTPGLRIAWGLATDVGRHREANEDSALALPPLFAVADGMGGHAAGDRASDLAVRRLARVADHRRGGASIEERVATALTDAALDIDRLSDELGVDAGTTATGAVLEGGAHPEAVVFNVGDSRVYQLEAGRLHQVTTDHSVVQELVDAGQLDADAAEYHPAANIITRALGFREAPRTDFVRVPAVVGVRLLICSDGLTKEVDRRHLRLLLASGLSAEVTASALVDAALSAGGRDNISVIVVDVLESSG